ncbi:MAG TPA: universal stress protein [Thermomicrobiales bacterium]|nr:universal stress protein [Thermomicrobiales bacterium]
MALYKRIIVPLDGSDLAEEALGQAKELARSIGSPIHLVRVVDTYRAQAIPASGMAIDYSMLAELAEEEIEDAKSYMKAKIDELQGEGLSVTGEVLHGPIAQQIVDAAEPGDVIVMSSHGRTGIKRWFLGSVAEEVMRRATCPVLLHRASGAAKTAETTD